MSRASGRLLLLGVVAFGAAAGCIRLGLWQLDRLAQRRSQNALLRQRANLKAVSISALRTQDTSVIHWRHATIRGVADYDAELVHATRSQRGAPGVFLLTPVRVLDAAWGDTAVLVLRGYVYAPDGRTINREKAREGDTVSFETLVTSFPAHTPGNVTMPSDARAVRVLDRDSLALKMHRPLAPFVLLALGDTVPRDIEKPARIIPPSLSEGSHQSYAFQWFGFATVAIVGFAAFAYTARRRNAN